MPEENPFIKKIAEFANRWSSHRIKFGGVVGKVTYISVAAIAGAVIVLGEPNTEWLKSGAVVVIVGFGWYVVRSVLGYASSHPEAMLEGSELLSYHQTVAAKGIESPKTQAPPIAGPLKQPEDTDKP